MIHPHLPINRHATTTLAALMLMAAPLAAQTGLRPNVTLSAGIAEYDLSGTGNTAVGAFGVSLPLTSFLSVDPALGFLRYESQGGSDISFLMPEVSLRLQIPGRRINPFVAVGGGMATTVEGRSDTDATLHTAVGFYLWLQGGWAVRPEARLRSIDPFIGVTADITLGVSRRF